MTAEATRHPILERQIRSARRKQIAQKRARTFDRARLPQHIVELERIAIFFSAVDDHARARTQKQFIAEQFLDELEERRAARQKAMTAEIEAKAVALLSAAQSADT